MGVQVHNLLFRHFDFPFSVTLDSTNSFWREEKIILTARFLAWLSSGSLWLFIFSFQLPFQRPFPTEPVGLESKDKGIWAQKNPTPVCLLASDRSS
jgi:hypothetical protein